MEPLVNHREKEEDPEKTENDRYSMTFTLDGEERTIELTLLNESSAMLTSVDDFACRYEREGNAVRLFIQKEAENGTVAIWDQVPHDYLLDQEQHALTAIQGVYAADLFTIG